jgi:hypothetical protein
VYSRILGQRMRSSGVVNDDASGARRGPNGAFRMDLRPDFRWPQLEEERKEGDDRRRSVRADGGENRFLGGSDPTLSGFSAAQRLRRRGSLPPKLSNRFSCSVAGRGPSRRPKRFES